MGYVQTTQQPRHAPPRNRLSCPSVDGGWRGAGVSRIGAAALALPFGWPAKGRPGYFGLSLVLAWFWRLGFADRCCGRVENWTGKDLDGDGSTGRPALQFATINGATARATVARPEPHRMTLRRARRRYRRLWTVAYLPGTSEGTHGITASGPDRDNYVACRDELLHSAGPLEEVPTGHQRVGGEAARSPGDVQGHRRATCGVAGRARREGTTAPRSRQPGIRVAGHAHTREGTAIDITLRTYAYVRYCSVGYPNKRRGREGGVCTEGENRLTGHV